jgi:hypothetical protein
LLAALCEIAQTQFRFTTPYHPRGNGLVERFVQTTLITLKKLIRGEEKDWDVYVPATQLCINCHISSLHQSRPFALFFGRPPIQMDSNENSQDTSDVDQNIIGDILKKRLNMMQEIVFPAIFEKVTEKQKKLCDKMKLQLAEFPVGSWVMTKDPKPKGKLAPIFEGPFKILKRTLGGSYLLQDTDGVLLNRRFAPSQLTLITPPEEIISNSSYIVEKILDHRGSPGHYEYLVKWANYSDEYNQWLSFEQFNDMEIIRQYWILKNSDSKRRKTKPPDL